MQPQTRIKRLLDLQDLEIEDRTKLELISQTVKYGLPQLQMIAELEKKYQKEENRT